MSEPAPNSMPSPLDGDAAEVGEYAAESGAAPAIPADATPMMAQYLEIKHAYPDALLFYRMGDFYEMFFDDAVKAAETLNIALTRRGKHLGEDIAMCGVPVHSHENYLERLIRRASRSPSASRPRILRKRRSAVRSRSFAAK